MGNAPTTHASDGDTLVRVQRRVCPRAGGSPTSTRIPFPTIHSPAGGVFAPTQHTVRAGSSAWENTGLSSAAVIGRGAEGREAGAVQPSNRTLGAPQYADGPGRRPAREGYAEGVDYPAVVGSSPTRPIQYRFTTTARPRPRQGRGPTSYRSARVPTRTVVERGPVRAATLDDNAHDELQE